MTSWTPADTREIDIATRRKDGSLRSYVPIWVVSDGSDVYVRSWKGTDGAWYRHALRGRKGSIRADGVGHEVVFGSEIPAGGSST